MKKYIPFVNSSDNGIHIERTSIECPYCHKIHIPEMYSAVLYKNRNECFIFCECTDKDCGFGFTRVYNIRKEEFMDIIQTPIWPAQKFVVITSSTFFGKKTIKRK